MNERRFFTPDTPEVLWDLLETAPDPRVLAGGTDLVVQMRKGMHPQAWVIDPARLFAPGVPGTGDWGPASAFLGVRQAGAALEIGAFTPYAELLRSERVRSAFPTLWEACRWIGSRQIRNRATPGGNLANASPAGDSLPPLLLHEAVIVCRSRRGRREVAASDFHTGYKKTALQKGELIESIRVPLEPAVECPYYRKAGPRKALAISRAAVCAGLFRTGTDGGRRYRLAAGGVAAVPVRLRAVEALLGPAGGPPPADGDLEAALRADIAPISDLRGGADYKFKVTLNFILDFLSGAGPSAAGRS